MFTIDASVWVNAVSPQETNHDKSRAFLDHVVQLGIRVVVPTLVRVEVTSSFSRAGKSAVRLRELYGLFDAVGIVQLIPLDEMQAKQAANMAAISQLKGADAIYASVALQFDCDLISLDNEHLKRLTSLINVLTPEQALDKLLGKRA